MWYDNNGDHDPCFFIPNQTLGDDGAGGGDFSKQFSELFNVNNALFDSPPVTTPAPPETPDNSFLQEALRGAARSERVLDRLELAVTDKLLTKLNAPVDKSTAAINMSALSLKIGSWKRNSKYDGELVAKCFSKSKKLTWEFSYSNGLGPWRKAKIEINWSLVEDIHVYNPTNRPGKLRVKLKNKPSFFLEVEPQPKKHTKWEITDIDFTNEQASDPLE